MLNLSHHVTIHPEWSCTIQATGHMTQTSHADWTPAPRLMLSWLSLHHQWETCGWRRRCSRSSPVTQAFTRLIPHGLNALYSSRVTHTCPLRWTLMVWLFICIRRRFCVSVPSSSVNDGSRPTSRARSSGHEPGSSYKWPSNVTTNWSATKRAWSLAR